MFSLCSSKQFDELSMQVSLKWMKEWKKVKEIEECLKEIEEFLQRMNLFSYCEEWIEL